ncbi:MAG TPA: glutaredoxin family protein [Tahibacter sp.]|nr:glutaredoxin family protein [Tahibacter sp.]
MAPNTRNFLWIVAVFAALAAFSAMRQRAIAKYDPRLEGGDDRIVLLAASWCGYCQALKAEFDRKHVPYRELDVEDGGKGEKAFAALGGQGVPVTVIGKEVVHGYDAERLTELLAARGYQLEL